MLFKKRGTKTKDLGNHRDRISGSVATSYGMPDDPFPTRVEDVRGLIEAEWQHCDDLVLREVDAHGTRVLLVWLRGMVDQERVEKGVLEPLSTLPKRRVESSQLESVLHTVLVRRVKTRQELNVAVSDGQAILCIDGSKEALTLDVSQPPGRAIEKAEIEPTLEGPQEAFVENLELNIALLRKRIRSPRLKVESMRIGVYSKTNVCILYIEGIVKPTLVKEAHLRLRKISIDAVNDINKLRELIADGPFTVFPTTEETERPDRVVAGLLQGRIAIMLDGAPTCLKVPVQFIHFLVSAEDYYMNYTLAVFIRVLRHAAYWASLLLPSLYVALLCYNQDLMPTPLLVTVASQHRGVPFPTILEALGMMGAFEVLREAGSRLPRAVGQSVSIVGTLVVGDAAVRAGLVSPGMVIVVAGTGVASFALPAYGFVNSSRIIQFLFVGVAGISGLVGIVVFGMILVTHLVSLRSFGVPYMAPIAPFSWQDMRDAFVRAPWFANKRRPKQFEPVDSVSNRSRAPRPPENSNSGEGKR
ncbi:spore germination protein [Alicyclobacillus fastidiosus]|uniref:Spore germination protein n=1 Tax=Alicyclobacillus fastidiosus TaxID=392011 RepID=A0ABV5AJN1_9BACL|nr:spore germination protein [Alicyclobacillus fastidiosus]WEH09111.1 spore germination protein [Alicyclobacillus fastidiosus]